MVEKVLKFTKETWNVYILLQLFFNINIIKFYFKDNLLILFKYFKNIIYKLIYFKI